MTFRYSTSLPAFEKASRAAVVKGHVFLPKIRTLSDISTFSVFAGIQFPWAFNDARNPYQSLLWLSILDGLLPKPKSLSRVPWGALPTILDDGKDPRFQTVGLLRRSVLRLPGVCRRRIRKSLKTGFPP